MFAPHWFRRFRLLFLIALSLASLVVFLPVAVPRAAAQSATSEPYNLVTNGDFTTGLSSWNWSAGMPIAGTETGCICGAGGPISHLPQAYAHPTGSGGLIYAWQNIPNVQAGQYILIGWINTSGGTQTAVIQADDGTGAAYCVTAQTHTTIWKQFFCSFNLPSPKTIHVALLADNSGPTAGGWVNWDDISLSVSSASGYDLLPYIGRTSGNGNAYVFASSEVDIVTASTNVMGANPGFYQLKVPSVSAPGTNTWEELSYDSSYIYRVRDTSPTATEWYEDLSSCPSACTPGSKWVPRTMTAGQSFFHSDNTIKFYFKTSCTPSRQAYQESNGIRMMGAYQHFTIFDAGNNLTSITLNNVIRLQWYSAAGVPQEDFYYAQGIGLVEWQNYDANGLPLSTQNYYTGPPPGQTLPGVNLNPPTSPALANPCAAGATFYEAEQPNWVVNGNVLSSTGNVVAGGASISSCSICSAGLDVGFIGNGGTLVMNNIIGKRGTTTYTLVIRYINGDASARTAFLRVNSGANISLSFPSTGNWSSPTLGNISVSVALAAGSNMLTFSNPGGWGPDIDWVSVS